MDEHLLNLKRKFDQHKEDILDMAFHVGYIIDLLPAQQKQIPEKPQKQIPEKPKETTWYNYIHFEMSDDDC